MQNLANVENAIADVLSLLVT